MTAIAADRLKSFVERIERLDTEQQAVGLDKRSVFDEAKGAGINTKMLRRHLAERKRDAKDSETDKETLDTYRALLEAPGSTYRGVAAQVGLSKTKLQRLVPKRENGTAEVPAASLSRESIVEGDSERRADPVGCDGADTLTKQTLELTGWTGLPSPLPPTDDLAIPDFLRRVSQ